MQILTNPLTSKKIDIQHGPTALMKKLIGTKVGNHNLPNLQSGTEVFVFFQNMQILTNPWKSFFEKWQSLATPLNETDRDQGWQFHG